MSDTTPKVAKIYRDMLMAKTPEERLKMACEMFDTGKILMKAGILAENNNLTETEIKAAIFTRLYQRDLPPEMFQRFKDIILHG